MCQAAEPALHEEPSSGVASEPQVGSIWAHWFGLVGPGSTGAAGYWGAGDAVCVTLEDFTMVKWKEFACEK